MPNHYPRNHSQIGTLIKQISFPSRVCTIAFCIGIAIVSVLLFSQLSPTQAQSISHSSPSQKQVAPLDSRAAIERLFTAPKIQSEWFAPLFLSQFPLTQIEQIITDFKTSFGAYQNVQPEGNNYVVMLERGKVLVQIALNPKGQITDLLLQSRLTAVEAIRQLETFPGQVNFLILEGSSELAALNVDRPLAVGSTFKLAVLEALQQQIKSGKHSWSEVVALQPQWKSLPTGILQTWFDEALLTIQTLATLMISQSDNTATDALIQIVGRESIEALTTRNRPFLTTRELFILKAPQNQTFLDRYRQGNLEQKRQVLNELTQVPLPSIASVSSARTALDIEWFFTPRELCHLMANAAANLPLMSVNPGNLVNPDDWSNVAYKGGSESGVLNHTTELRSRNGKTYCVSATWNNANAPLDEMRLSTIYSGVIEGLKVRN